jgi:fused signal recognition particle receptor
MRFWRPGIPSDPASDGDTVPPEPDKTDPMPASSATPPLTETAVQQQAPSGPMTDSESSEPQPVLPPRTWFDRLMGGPEPAGAGPPGTMSPRPPTPSPADAEREPGGWFGRLRAGLSRSSAQLNDGINAIFLRRRLDAAALDELEELLIASDMGLGVAGEVVESLRRTRFNQEVAPDEVRAALAEEVIRLVEPVMRPLRIDSTKKPFVVLVVGVNGSGKTTTIGKLAKQYRAAGNTVVLAAGDTFRAAAVEQLQIWGERTGTPVISGGKDADSAGLAFDALTRAEADKADVLLIDTAGRLHNKAALMEELRKIIRVLRKKDPTAPHSVLLVLDATTGQNAVQQVKVFKEMVDVTGLVVTKLDGTARGGVLVALAERFGLPVRAIGVGEGADDLRPFSADSYARSLLGLPTE